jgi:putative hydrolase of the HAD superfamily
MTPGELAPQQALLIDADDTLWENNLYFERAIARFIAYLDHQQHSAAAVREALNRWERSTIAAHGYGVLSFRRALVSCLEELAQHPVTEQQREQVTQFAQSIADHQIELLPGVAETLPSLAERHRLILVTKGNAMEQRAKLDASGIHMHFTAVEIPAEKHEAAYRAIVARYGLCAQTTWMIGNSPRSDINPALAAGLNAVYVHHPHTWALEQATLDRPTEPRTLLQLSTFSQLTDHF